MESFGGFSVEIQDMSRNQAKRLKASESSRSGKPTRAPVRLKPETRRWTAFPIDEEDNNLRAMGILWLKELKNEDVRLFEKMKQEGSFYKQIWEMEPSIISRNTLPGYDHLIFQFDPRFKTMDTYGGQSGCFPTILQIYSLKLTRKNSSSNCAAGDVDDSSSSDSLDVYGHLTLHSRLNELVEIECHTHYPPELIFDREEGSSQSLTEKDPYLLLTDGPFLPLATKAPPDIHVCIYAELVLKVTDGTGDKDLIISGGQRESFIQYIRQHIDGEDEVTGVSNVSKSREEVGPSEHYVLELTRDIITNSTVATISLHLLPGHSYSAGCPCYFTACDKSHLKQDFEIVLLDSTKVPPSFVDDDGSSIFQLSRKHVCVDLYGTLIVGIKYGNYMKELEFDPIDTGVDEETLWGGIQVRVEWSTYPRKYEQEIERQHPTYHKK
ncbi:hypothetical protein OROGR_015857 [Orobanche gracilis]